MSMRVLLLASWQASVWARTVPQEREELLCQIAQGDGMKDTLVDDMCVKVTRVFPDLKLDPDCKTVADLVWDAGFTAICKEPGHISPPLVQTVEQQLCEVASRKQLEDHVVDEVCKAIVWAFPAAHFSPNCNVAAERVWDAAVAMCPQGHMSFAMALQIPRNVEQLVCELASAEGNEDEVADAVCKKVKELFPHVKLNPVCKTLVESFWEAGLSGCPKSKALEAAAPQDIEKVIYDLASQKQVEDRTVDEVCQVIAQLFPLLPHPVCKVVVEGAWDAVVAIAEELLCEVVASHHDLEDKVVEAFCTKLEQSFPELQLKGHCQAILESVWDATVKKCSKHDNKAFKEACGLARLEFARDLYTKKGCSLLETLFPTMAEEKCEQLLGSVWDFGLAFCPAEVVEAQNPLMTSTLMPMLDVTTSEPGVVVI